MNAREWYKEGKTHRDGDLPAMILSNGDQEWYKEGEMVNFQMYNSVRRRKV
jgi:hypothetical protein